MKKTILTLSVMAFFASAANAQERKAVTNTQPKKATTVEKATVKADGTGATTTEKKKEETTPVKTGGTRMAINEKGLPGSSRTTKKEPEKAGASPAQPGTSAKKD